MRWRLSYRADPRAKAVADRHYNRQNPNAAQFVPPGGCLVLACGDRPGEADAVWVTSTPIAEYVQHAWAGAWVNSLFRNESPQLASELIIEAVAASQAVLGAPPPLGMVTMVDPTKVRPNRQPGRVYLRAGFRQVGMTKGGLLVFQQLPEEMPPPVVPLPAYTFQLSLLEGNLL